MRRPPSESTRTSSHLIRCELAPVGARWLLVGARRHLVGATWRLVGARPHLVGATVAAGRCETDADRCNGGRWSVRDRTWSVRGGCWSVRDGIWSVRRGCWSVRDRTWSVRRGCWSVRDGTWSVQRWTLVGARWLLVGARWLLVGATVDADRCNGGRWSVQTVEADVYVGLSAASVFHHRRREDQWIDRMRHASASRDSTAS